MASICGPAIFGLGDNRRVNAKAIYLAALDRTASAIAEAQSRLRERCLAYFRRSGVRTETAGHRSLSRTIRAVATIEASERGLYAVSPKFESWIDSENKEGGNA